MVAAWRGDTCRIISARRANTAEGNAHGRGQVHPGPEHPPELTEGEARTLDGLTDAEITAAAEADPDNPPLTDAELERVGVARRVRAVRAALGLTQEGFAARYGIPVGTLRQWELGRRAPDRAALSSCA